ncbi:uncharacterized protein EV422DRAFT_620933 [Fimicolochytrium jonesii]|uniref:uncharacterized protein n=1 Tax=Fimicolochytrium jonesii TaxID=1396493 RepID=UPI0022FEAE9F|nr:uncharacterized protein EV422DRAFT_620933 [Fimicolochytrium jonesii]KAI8819638.1 hypothetical protein EV422DRAFT_620933 [Fimicolochytrium jonesii]
MRPSPTGSRTGQQHGHSTSARSESQQPPQQQASLSGSPQQQQNSSELDEERTTLQAFRARVATNRQHAAEERLRRVNRVLRRAEVSRVANALKKRLEYAKLKVRHGWQQKTFDEVKALYMELCEKREAEAVAARAAEARQAAPPPPPPIAEGEEIDPSMAAAANCLIGISHQNDHLIHRNVSPEKPPAKLAFTPMPASSRQFAHQHPSPPGTEVQSNGSSGQNLGSIMTQKLREETDAYFAKLGLPSLSEFTALHTQNSAANSELPPAAPSDTSSSFRSSARKATSAYHTHHHHPYFPSPAPSPIISRVTSPTNPQSATSLATAPESSSYKTTGGVRTKRIKLTAPRAPSSAGFDTRSQSFQSTDMQVDPDAEQGALLLMMMQRQH